MDKQQRIEEVRKYIEQYYIPGNDDTGTDDEEAKDFFDNITRFIEREAQFEGSEETLENAAPVEPREAPEPEFDISTANPEPEFDVSTVKRAAITHQMSEMTVGNRMIDDLMAQMDETFSQRLLRMIRERNMTEAETYKKAFVDRRHFSKIKRDKYYAPNKKTVLAFAIALELSLDETKDLLRSAGYALSRSSKSDIIIVYFIENQNYNMFDINEVLFEYDQPVFE